VECLDACPEIFRQNGDLCIEMDSLGREVVKMLGTWAKDVVDL